MLFDFYGFIEELRQKPEKKQIIEKYEEIYGPLQGNLKEQPRYVDYVVRFPALGYKVPEDLKSDFDRDLLQQLVISSFSSDYEIKKDNESNDKELFIAVKSGDQSVVKTISELRSFQILRLYEIYIEEQINLHTLRGEDENELQAIDGEREVRIKRRKAVLDTIDKEQIAQQAKVEQENKLGDLMSQL